MVFIIKNNMGDPATYLESVRVQTEAADRKLQTIERAFANKNKDLNKISQRVTLAKKNFTKFLEGEIDELDTILGNAYDEAQVKLKQFAGVQENIKRQKKETEEKSQKIDEEYLRVKQQGDKMAEEVMRGVNMSDRLEGAFNRVEAYLTFAKKDSEVTRKLKHEARLMISSAKEFAEKVRQGAEDKKKVLADREKLLKEKELTIVAREKLCEFREGEIAEEQEAIKSQWISIMAAKEYLEKLKK